MKPKQITTLSFLAPLVALVAAGCANDASGTPPTPTGTAVLSVQSQSSRSAAHVCPGPAAPGDARCHAIVVADAQGQAVTNTAPAGYGPADLLSAYGLASSSATGMTVAVVDAYDYPSAESDLAVYRSTFGLPPCTTANGCFSKVNQNGVRGSYPRANSSWSQEMALDLDMVSAICPGCNILLVEATSSSLSNLGAGVNTAAKLGAIAISNSYGGGELSSEASAETQYYLHPGIAVTASRATAAMASSSRRPRSTSRRLAAPPSFVRRRRREAGARPRGAEPGAVAARTSRSPHGRSTRAARIARSPTCRQWLIQVPVSPSTRPSAEGEDGRSSAGRASHLRSSRACTRSRLRRTPHPSARALRCRTLAPPR